MKPDGRGSRAFCHELLHFSLPRVCSLQCSTCAGPQQNLISLSLASIIYPIHHPRTRPAFLLTLCREIVAGALNVSPETSHTLGYGIDHFPRSKNKTIQKKIQKKKGWEGNERRETCGSYRTCSFLSVFRWEKPHVSRIILVAIFDCIMWKYLDQRFIKCDI